MSAPPVGSRTVAATRVSTLAKALDDQNGLFAYVASTTLEVVASRAALRTRLALIEPGDDGWRAYKQLHDDAQALRGTPEADDGTAIHSTVEAIVNGRDVSGVDEVTKRDAYAVLVLLAREQLEPVETEAFGVTLDLPELVAGTRDMLVRDKRSGIVRVLDMKSTATLGRERWAGLSWSVQLACYAHARPYREPVERDRWGRPHVDVALLGDVEHEVDQREGIVVEVLRGGGGRGITSRPHTKIHRVDLVAGWQYAELACRVRAARKAYPFIKNG